MSMHMRWQFSYIITCKLSRHSDYSTQVVLDVKILVDWTPGHEDGLSVSSHWDVYTWGLNRDFMLCWCIVDLIISLMHCWLDSCTCILGHTTSNLFWLEGVGSCGLILAYTCWNLFKLVWLLVLIWVMVQRCVVDFDLDVLMESLFAHTYLVHLCCTHWSFTSGWWLVDSLTHEKLVDLHTHYLFGTHWCFTSGWWVVDSFTYALFVHLHRGSYTWMLVLCQAFFSFDVWCV